MTGYDLTLAAEGDLRGIWQYTHETWGADQADRYLGRIEACFEAIAEGRVRPRSDDALPGGVRVHRCEHHYVFWIAGERPTVVAILHERMDLVSRLKDRL